MEMNHFDTSSDTIAIIILIPGAASLLLLQLLQMIMIMNKMGSCALLATLGAHEVVWPTVTI